MRSQGVLVKIVALFALILLVLPASARVASCMSIGQKMTCYMAKASVAPKPTPAKVIEDCCHPKVKSAPKASTILEEKAQCHCVQKPIPTSPTTISVLDFGAETVETTVPTQEKLLPQAEPIKVQLVATFYNDSGPPDELHGSSWQGRAPPVSVL